MDSFGGWLTNNNPNNTNIKQRSGEKQTMLEITDVKIRKLIFTGRLKAICSITLCNSFAVHDIKIVEGSRGSLIVAMPSRRMDDGEFKDTAHPINQTARQMIQDKVLKAYEEELERYGA